MMYMYDGIAPQCAWEAKDGDQSCLCSAGCTLPGVLGQVLGPQVQKKRGQTGVSPGKGNQDE